MTTVQGAVIDVMVRRVAARELRDRLLAFSLLNTLKVAICLGMSKIHPRVFAERCI
jgi:hypothetical protein